MTKLPREIAPAANPDLVHICVTCDDDALGRLVEGSLEDTLHGGRLGGGLRRLKPPIREAELLRDDDHALEAEVGVPTHGLSKWLHAVHGGGAAIGESATSRPTVRVRRSATKSCRTFWAVKSFSDRQDSG